MGGPNARSFRPFFPGVILLCQPPDHPSKQITPESASVGARPQGGVGCGVVKIAVAHNKRRKEKGKEEINTGVLWWVGDWGGLPMIGYGWTALAV